MFTQPFMQNAFLTGPMVAVLAGVVGFFVVLRGMSFAAHSLGQVGFAGAAGAALVGVDPSWGLVIFAVDSALGIGPLGARRARTWRRPLAPGRRRRDGGNRPGDGLAARLGLDGRSGCRGLPPRASSARRVAAQHGPRIMSMRVGIALARDTGLPVGFFSAVIVSLCSVVARLAATFR